MIKNYLLIALRHFWKNKSFSFIKIAGLALSMAVCMLLIVLIKDANDYDHFHPGGSRIYRINTEALRKDGGKEPYATSPYAVASALASNYAGIDEWTMLNSRTQTDIIFEDRKFSFDLHFTGNSFFKVFGFSLESGNPAVVLNEPFTIVLTKALAEKLFPAGNSIGQTVEVRGQGLFKITGILNEFPGKTHMEFDALASFATIPSLEKKNTVMPTINNWQNYYSNYTYIHLKPGVTVSQVEASLAEIASTNYKNLPLETRDGGYRFKLQALNKITPGPLLSNNMGRGIPVAILWFLGVLAFVIILSAAFNYTNLTIAKAMGRMKEIALRKVVGSSRRHIFIQVIVESIVIALLALLLALVFLHLLIPRFRALNFISMTDINFNLDATVILLFIAFAVVVGIIAGLLPATMLSGIRPLVLMQKLQNIKLFRHLGLRKVLLVIQFMICLVFINMVAITYRQMQHAVNINFGTKQTHIFNVPLQGLSHDKAVQEFSKVPGVEKISATSILMGNYQDWSDDVRVDKDKDPVSVREYFTDENYIPNLKLQLVAGQNFPANPSQKHEQFAIVNEKFTGVFQLGKPAEAIGKTIIVGDSTSLTILGVIKDFLYKPAEYELAPMMMRYNPENWAILNLSIASGNIMQTTSKIEAVWKKMDPYHPFAGRFYDEETQSIFSDMRDVIWMVAFIAVLGITIACLGLLGITIFTVQSKTKEVSIRKVVGAGPVSIIRLLTKSYVQVMLIAIVLTIPIVIFLGNMLLQAMSQHISMSIGLFVPGVLLIVLLSLLTISSQTLKAVFLNPVNGLRTE